MNTLNPHHISNTRLRNTIAAVLLVHVALLWVAQSQLAELPASDESGQVVMADVVSDIPNPTPLTHDKQAPTATPTPTPTPTKSVTKTDTLALTPNSSNAQEAAASNAAAAPSTASGKTGSPSLVEPSADADYLKNPPPGYPRISRRNGEQGTVIVRVFISTQGTPEKAEVRTSSGFARLDQAALEAVQRWRFMPGRRNGTPEAMWFNIPVRFILE
ncbi:energy transducer TonB [Limnohabitans sp. TS-CS-82]|uniref:energy transducer TonB n=1 Tax=Limnohabitans sp. TS-CS-82 TaxID=2094193 RepID=UPI001F221F46|nr:energy transducer TonB [Limnohabitans sp. TS-CS-82]